MTVAPPFSHSWAWWISLTSLPRLQFGYRHVLSRASTALAWVAEKVRWAREASNGSPCAVRTILLSDESHSSVASSDGARAVPSSNVAGSKPYITPVARPALISPRTLPSSDVRCCLLPKHWPCCPRPSPEVAHFPAADGGLEPRLSDLAPSSFSKALMQPFSMAPSIPERVANGT